jgi:hypothetical protein
MAMKKIYIKKCWCEGCLVLVYDISLSRFPKEFLKKNSMLYVTRTRNIDTHLHLHWHIDTKNAPCEWIHLLEGRPLEYTHIHIDLLEDNWWTLSLLNEKRASSEI